MTLLSVSINSTAADGEDAKRRASQAAHTGASGGLRRVQRLQAHSEASLAEKESVEDPGESKSMISGLEPGDEVESLSMKIPSAWEGFSLVAILST